MIHLRSLDQVAQLSETCRGDSFAQREHWNLESYRIWYNTDSEESRSYHWGLPA